MNTVPENITLNSSQYTPVYFIQNAGPTQANYVISLGNVEQTPVSDNLKSFYEKSGNIEAAAPAVISSPKPRIIKKAEVGAVRNNLKLASFLMPKNDKVNKQYVVSNVLVKPSVSTLEGNPTNTVPKIDIDRKIVKLKDGPPITSRSRHVERFLPKIKPKVNAINPTQAKLTSVQLIKLGETYHSLNKLSDEQMKMVNQALKIFSDPEKIAPEPTYDPVTNTRFIYKVVSPRDLTVVGKKNLMVNEKKEEKKHDAKKEPAKRQIFTEENIEEAEPPAVTKVTRSGRTVKLPKMIIPQETPCKPKKKNHIVTCFQCSTEFTSLYRLQKHYESHPTHIPAKIHSNLFHCLLAIVKGGSEEDRTNIFLQQLEQLVVKLKSLLPCLLKKIDGMASKPCTINDDVGRIFGMNPGKYDIDVNALNCVRDKDGYCVHNPPANQVTSENTQPTHIYITTPSEEHPTSMEEDCARSSSAENWPTVNKRVWKLKKLKSQKLGAKKMRLETDNDSLLQLETTETKKRNEKQDTPENLNNMKMRLVFQCDDILDQLGVDQPKSQNEAVVLDTIENNKPLMTGNVTEQSKRPKGHAQFYSTHFDIRSSPIKTGSTVFRKFQINPEHLPKYDVQIIGASDIDKDQAKVYDQTTTDTLQEIFRENNIEMTCKENNIIEQEWIITANEKSEEAYTKSNNLISPALIHVKNTDKILHENSVQMHTNDSRIMTSQDDSVLNFFDALGNTLSYPETELRTNSVDFHLDLF